MAIRVAGICGSLREASLNKGLLQAAAELATAEMEIQIYTRLGDIPPYNDDVFIKGDPEPVADLKKFIGGAVVRRQWQTYRREHAPAREEISRRVCRVDRALQGLADGAQTPRKTLTPGKVIG